jgi:hypothetical protein
MRPARACSLAVVAVLAVLLAGARPAEAHQSSVTYSRATVLGDRVTYRILIDQLDAAVLIGDDLDLAAITAEQRAALATSVTRAITISDDTVRCLPGPVTIERDGSRVAVTWTAACPAPIAVLAIDYDLLFFDDPNHVAALEVRVPGRAPASTLLDVEHARFVWPLGDAAPSRFVAFVRAGIHHVATGLDHVCFVLALLLAVVLVRDPTAADGRGWRVRPLGQALRATAMVASAFTLAHSLTLIAAALGWVAVPVKVVETAIALSIVWTAIEDIIRPDVRWRFALTFGFGLMHGLGFARMLAVLLPPADRIVPLLAFNVGVELAHLAVIAVALPLAWLVARRVGAHAYRTRVLPAAGGVLALLGLVWMIERVGGVVLLGL